MSDKVIVFQLAHNGIERLHENTVGIDPEAAVARQQKCTNVVGTVGGMLTQIDVAIDVAHAIEVFRE